MAEELPMRGSQEDPLCGAEAEKKPLLRVKQEGAEERADDVHIHAEEGFKAGLALPRKRDVSEQIDDGYPRVEDESDVLRPPEEHRGLQVNLHVG